MNKMLSSFLYVILKVHVKNMAQWLSWLERRPVTAEVESSSLFWVVCTKVQQGIIAQLGEHLPYKQGVIGSSPIGPIMDGFPSGQRGQTVNLLATLSKVRILPHPRIFISRGGAVWKLVGLITRRS